MKNTKPAPKATPAYIIDAAQKMLAEAPEISASQITAAFRALGADAESAAPKPRKRAA